MIMKYKVKIATLEKQIDGRILVRLNVVDKNDPTEKIGNETRDKIVRQISFHSTKKELKAKIADEIKQCHKLLFKKQKLNPASELGKEEFDIDDKTGEII